MGSDKTFPGFRVSGPLPCDPPPDFRSVQGPGSGITGRPLGWGGHETTGVVGPFVHGRGPRNSFSSRDSYLGH